MKDISLLEYGGILLTIIGIIIISLANKIKNKFEKLKLR